MSGALGYLTWISLRNRWRAQLRRLRQPRYAIALLLGIAYIWMFLLRPQPRPVGTTSPLLGADARSLAELGVLMLVAGAWLFAGGRLALAFAPAEVDFLFPAPLTRRQLVVYKLLRAQLVVVFNTLLWVFILRRSGSDLPALVRAVTAWVFFTTLYLHRVGAGLARAAWLEHGRAGVRKQRLTTAVFVAAVGALVWAAVRAAPALAASSGATVLGTVVAATRTAPASWVLAPLRWTLAPAFAQTMFEWTRAIGPALILLGLNAVWVLSADVAFEEAAAEASRERVRRIEALRTRRAGAAIGKARLRGVLPLAPVGRAEVAILWKNVLAFVRTVQMGRLVGVLAFAAVTAVITSEGGDGPSHPIRFVAVLASMTAALLVILGPRVVRNDLRMDMASLELVKAFPLAGRAIVASEIAASLGVLVALQALLALVGYVAYLADPMPLASFGVRPAYLAIAPVVAVSLDAIALTAQNAAAVLIPSWVQTGSIVGGGVELLGQNLLMTLAMILVMVLALLPPALLAGAGLVVAQSVGATQGLALGAAAVVALGGVAGELWLTVLWLGRALERAEPAVTGGVL